MPQSISTKHLPQYQSTVTHRKNVIKRTVKKYIANVFLLLSLKIIFYNVMLGQVIVGAKLTECASFLTQYFGTPSTFELKL